MCKWLACTGDTAFVLLRKPAFKQQLTRALCLSRNAVQCLWQNSIAGTSAAHATGCERQCIIKLVCRVLRTVPSHIYKRQFYCVHGKLHHVRQASKITHITKVHKDKPSELFASMVV